MSLLSSPLLYHFFWAPAPNSPTTAPGISPRRLYQAAPLPDILPCDTSLPHTCPHLRENTQTPPACLPSSQPPLFLTPSHVCAFPHTVHLLGTLFFLAPSLGSRLWMPLALEALPDPKCWACAPPLPPMLSPPYTYSKPAFPCWSHWREEALSDMPHSVLVRHLGGCTDLTPTICSVAARL